MQTNYVLSCPKFRDGVAIEFFDKQAAILYREQSCDLEFENNAKKDVQLLLKLLMHGKTSIDRIISQLPVLKKETISIINELDRNGLLLEMHVSMAEDVVSGKQLYQDVLQLFDQMTVKQASSAFYKLLLNEAASKQQLIGYAVEYYHLVKLAPGIVGPVLAKIEGRKTREIWRDFLRSEFYHDKMLEKSLASVGITREMLDDIQPLPSTFSLCASLGVYAQQHPLSFKCALFMFEKPYPEFNVVLKQQCEKLNMPKEFYMPILRHADINADDDHGSISQTLLAEIPVISKEESMTAKKHVAVLVESLLLQEQEIIHYYGGMEYFQARLFF